MKTKLISSLAPIQITKEFSGDTLTYFYFQNDKKEAALSSQTLSEVQDLAKKGIFNASAKSLFFVRASYIENQNILIAGLGNKKIFTPEKARQTGAMAASKLMAEKIKKLGISVDTLLLAAGRPTTEACLRAFLEGFYLAQYTFNKHKSQAPALHKIESVELVSKDKKNHTWLNTLAEETLITVDCIYLARDFSNEPSNHGTPEYYANELSRLSKIYGLKCKVLGEAEAKKEKMNLFLAVGEGSVREGKVVILEYTPKTKATKTLSLIGKGVTFDAGGISIKPSARMEDMKHDMTGAATIAGATFMAARLGAKHKLLTILVFTENMPSGSAVQPGNVITSRNGKTVEIINTDAEGRLILADALDLAQDYKPELMIDAATLTGACSIALGKLASALFVNDSKLRDQIMKSSNATEEALWELPMWDEYFEDLKTPSADMANSANDGYGGTIRGAVFMKQFIRPGMRWAHIDLANRAYDQGYLPYNPRKGASGLYVRTLAHFVLNYQK